MAGTDRTVGQTSHRLISQALGDELRRAVHAGPSIADQADSIRYRVSAVLYLILRDHAIDHRAAADSAAARRNDHHPAPALPDPDQGEILAATPT